MTIACVLMDIEGTITPVAFVQHVLFPYAKSRLGSFLDHHRDHPAVMEWVRVCQNTVEQEHSRRPSYEDLPAILSRWMEEDRKHPGLKAIQGMIWQEGYRTGAFTPDLYEDVMPALVRWRGYGLRLALYSSGSEQAQRLLIEHTSVGDLTNMFSKFFDTGVGAKTEPVSYRRIAEALAIPPEAMVFLSDTEAELDAASASGFVTRQIVRPGTRQGTRHPVSLSFRDIPIPSGPADERSVSFNGQLSSLW